MKCVEELYSQQPPENSQYSWNRLEYRPLEGFVLAVSPFNFTAIGGNLAGAPALVGNVVVWKPSSTATYSNYIIHRILLEAGLPPSVIQFVPGPPAQVVTTALGHREFAGLHFTGSTKVFRNLWKEIGNNVGQGAYKSYPRVVGETGGKNWHLVHQSADVKNAVLQSVRSAFEYQGQFIPSSFPPSCRELKLWIGQKCSALSRVYVASSVWPQFKQMLLEETAKIKVGPSEKWENFMGPVM